MIRLFTSYFDSGDPGRQKELNECLKRNLQNNIIDQVVLLAETPPLFNPTHLTVINHPRPTYSNFFDAVNSVTRSTDINIIANSDIYFDGSLRELIGVDLKNKCLALSRSDRVKSKLIPHHARDSQDAWIVRGEIENVYGDFLLGRPGCDNRIAAEFEKAGYEPVNACKTITLIHLHETQVKSYVRTMKYIVPPPHKRVDPCYL